MVRFSTVLALGLVALGGVAVLVADGSPLQIHHNVHKIDIEVEEPSHFKKLLGGLKNKTKAAVRKIKAKLSGKEPEPAPSHILSVPFGHGGFALAAPSTTPTPTLFTFGPGTSMHEMVHTLNQAGLPVITWGEYIRQMMVSTFGSDHVYLKVKSYLDTIIDFYKALYKVVLGDDDDDDHDKLPPPHFHPQPVPFPPQHYFPHPDSFPQPGSFPPPGSFHQQASEPQPVSLSPPTSHPKLGFFPLPQLRIPN